MPKNTVIYHVVSLALLLFIFLSLVPAAAGRTDDHVVKLVARKAIFVRQNAPADPGNAVTLTVAFVDSNTGRFAAGTQGEAMQLSHPATLGTFEVPPVTEENGVTCRTLDVYSDLSNINDLRVVAESKYCFYGVARRFKAAGLVEIGEARDSDAEVLVDTGQDALGRIPVNIIYVGSDNFTMVAESSAGALMLNEENYGSPIVQYQGGKRKLVGVLENAGYIQPDGSDEKVWVITAARAQLVYDEMKSMRPGKERRG